MSFVGLNPANKKFHSYWLHYHHYLKTKKKHNDGDSLVVDVYPLKFLLFSFLIYANCLFVLCLLCLDSIDGEVVSPTYSSAPALIDKSIPLLFSIQHPSLTLSALRDSMKHFHLTCLTIVWFLMIRAGSPLLCNCSHVNPRRNFDSNIFILP